MEPVPPKFLLRLLTLFSRAIYLDVVSGDCEEMYKYIYAERGRSKALHWLWKQVLKSMPLFFINSLEWGGIMFRNYLKIAFRNILKHKGYSLINISGFAIGITCCLFILLWVQDELSFDRFHENRDEIYRLLSVGRGGSTWDGMPAPLAPAIKEEIPGVIDAARTLDSPRFVLKYGEKAFYEDNGLIADPSFFKMFSFPLVKGDAETGLSTPFSILISQRMAHRYFGDQDPMNQLIDIEGQEKLKVGGIFKNVPANSHLQFDFVLPFLFTETVGLRGQNWGDFNFRTYVQLVPDSDDLAVGKKINESAKKHGCPQVMNKEVSLSLQPLTEIYLHPLTKNDKDYGNIKMVRIFSLVALFILIIASINFINLTTARSENRAREIGMRKVMGGTRRQLMWQFLGESLFLAFIALFFAVILIQLLLPLFNGVTGKNLIFSYLDFQIIFGLLILALLVGLLAGLYPAFYLSSFKPVDVIKGNWPLFSFLRGGSTGVMKKASLRKILVVFQFSVSVILIICTLVVYDQLNYIKDKSWRLAEDLIIHVPIKENVGTRYDFVKNELLKYPQIVDVTVKDCLPTGLRNNTSGVYWEGRTAVQDNIYMETTRVGFDYFKTMDMEIVEGRAFSREFSRDSSEAYILNETAIRTAGIKDPVGKMFQLYRKKGVIIGVVKDTHFKYMTSELNSQVYHLLTDIPRQAFFGSVFIRISGVHESSDISEVVKYVKKTWEQVNSVAPFEFYFLDETIAALYENEQRLGTIFTYFAFLAVFISCLGLFGLSSFLVVKRTKEIGIRKTLGASVGHLVLMLTKDFSKWVILSTVIAFPLAYLIMKKWLQNFAYRTDIDVWIFLASGFTALFIAFITVSFQSIRAAEARPVESLRYE